MGRFDEQEDARLRGEELDLAVVDAAHRDHVWGGASIYDVHPHEARVGVGTLGTAGSGTGRHHRDVRGSVRGFGGRIVHEVIPALAFV